MQRTSASHALLLSLSIAAPAQAADLWLNLGGISRHGGDKVYNERNPGLGLETTLTPQMFAAFGAYKNSGATRSWYGGCGFHNSPWHGLSAGVFTGLVTGYSMGKVLPLFAPFARVESQRAAVTLMVLGGASPVVTLQFKLRLKEMP